MTRPKHLIVFAREPRIGRVKRRLSAGLGVVAATFWYRRQLASLLRRLRGHAPWKRHLFLTPKTALGAKVWPKGWIKHAQVSGDLGARMHHALSAPRTGPVVLVGSDIPGIQPRHIEAAFRALGRADVVLGPAEDGGYWLIGVAGNRTVPRLDSVRWSTRYALTDTIAGFPSGTKVILLETLRDIDEASDLEEV
jgi:rSAM/selenodomain-associated transferase 1